MTRAEALLTLRRFQSWRRYGGGPGTDGPDCPEPRELGEALDVAIAQLASLEAKPPREYYGG